MPIRISKKQAALGFVLGSATPLVPILFGVISAQAGSTFKAPPWKRPSQPVYIIADPGYSFGLQEGSVAPGNKIAIELIPAPGIGPGAHQVGPFPLKRPLRVFRGGQTIGTFSIEKLVDFHCESHAGVGKVVSKEKLSGEEHALATDAPEIHGHESWLKAGDASAKRLIERLAIEELKKKGRVVGKTDERGVSVVVVSKIGKGGPKFTAGTVKIRSAAALESIFLITDGTKVTLFNYVHSTDPDGKDLESEQFLDQLDFDRDGLDEIVAQRTGYESQDYLIYKWEAGMWVQVWKSVMEGC